MNGTVLSASKMGQSPQRSEPQGGGVRKWCQPVSSCQEAPAIEVFSEVPAQVHQGCQ